MSENLKPPTDSETSTSPNGSDPLTLDTSLMQAAEARMRRALGLESGGMKQRAPDRTAEPASRMGERFTPNHKRRFVHDGEVPVTIVNGRREGQGEATPHRGAPAAGPTRLEVAEAALAAEANARHQADRALGDAQVMIRDLQTKLGHAELARIEAAAQLHQAQETAANLRAELHACEERLQAAESTRRLPRRSGLHVEPAMDADDTDDAVTVVAPAPAPRKSPGRRGKAVGQKSDRKSRLVRWWVKDAAQGE